MIKDSDTGQAAGARVPRAAAWLGGLGAIPFLALALGDVLLGEQYMAAALAAYGAVILSFLGGVHWGLAIAGEQSQGGTGLARRLTVSVIPSLIGWGALLLPVPAGLFVLAAAFLLMLAVDLRAASAGETPAWYPTLRWPLTLVVAASLFVAAAI